jgi:hypothetical protein
MKCKACHHLNCSSDAECFMCNAPLYRGAPKVHGALFVFLALCVFIPVFSATGGVIRVLPWFGVNTAGMRAGGGPGVVPLVIGFLGVNLCLLITRFQISFKEQLVYSALVTALAWGAYLFSIVALAKEISGSPRRRVEAPPAVVRPAVAAVGRGFSSPF